MTDDARDPKYFTLTEAERTRTEVEPLLIEAIELGRKIGHVDEQLQQAAQRIAMLGGALVTRGPLEKLRVEQDRLNEAIRGALTRIEATGCVVKDLDVGLLDFPAVINDEEVYLCWRLGEDRIRFYHRQDEGFDGRKPLDPRHPEPTPPVH
ncbi:MAG: DUF2203 domain-containing protein [Acidipila sp.]|nr:DUF2203 domain-containing protein [Acidipila sp.]